MNSPGVSIAYGLANTKAATAASPAQSNPATIGSRPSARKRCSAAASNGSATIPPVYLVAHANPRPIPAIAQSRRLSPIKRPAVPQSDRAIGASVGTSLSAWCE